jgi:hypothetical protein
MSAPISAPTSRKVRQPTVAVIFLTWRLRPSVNVKRIHQVGMLFRS